MTVWVTGAAGMLGQEIVRILKSTSGAVHNVIATDRYVDIMDHVAVSRLMSEQGPVDWIVNCAGWTAVDDAEANPEAAWGLNAKGPRILAKAADRYGARLVHISTDYVFSGDADRPYRPEDPVSPESVYGQTKWDGEQEVRSVLQQHVIIRTAWLYGPNGKNFVATMLRLMSEREEISVVADQYGLPTYAPDLAEAIKAILIADSDITPWGTYHYTNAPGAREATTGISWFDFAQAIYERGWAHGLLSSHCKINPVTTADYPTAAPRPAYSVLDCTTIAETFGISPPDWRRGLEAYLTQVAPIKHK